MNTRKAENDNAAAQHRAAIRAAERALAELFRSASLAEMKESQLRVREAVVREALRRAR